MFWFFFFLPFMPFVLIIFNWKLWRHGGGTGKVTANLFHFFTITYHYHFFNIRWQPCISVHIPLPNFCPWVITKCLKDWILHNCHVAFCLALMENHKECGLWDPICVRFSATAFWQSRQKPIKKASTDVASLFYISGN